MNLNSRATEATLLSCLELSSKVPTTVSFLFFGSHCSRRNCQSILDICIYGKMFYVLLKLQFCEDVGYSLSANIIQKSHGVTDDGMSRFVLKSVVESEIITFQALNYCVDFQDSFFLFVEV